MQTGGSASSNAYIHIHGIDLLFALLRHLIDTIIIENLLFLDYQKRNFTENNAAVSRSL